MNTVKDRLVAFIEYKGLSKNKFERMCGLSYRYVSNISKSIQPAMIEKISLKFPELNMGWIVTGEGEMLKTSPQPEAGKTDSDKLAQELAEIIKKQQDTIHLLTEMLNRRQNETSPKKAAVGL